jgi:hypothetical protein
MDERVARASSRISPARPAFVASRPPRPASHVAQDVCLPTTGAALSKSAAVASSLFGEWREMRKAGFRSVGRFGAGPSASPA